MALNKFMHPRNIYRKPPDFAKLAIEYPEFQKIAKLDVTGKVSIDFKDAKALRTLTKCLLHSNFNLIVIIPEDKLVPTLSLRLNYLLWVEDLLRYQDNERNITGIDIGTGACAIYPLLSASKNKWKMIGTESDPGSYETALQNVSNNNLTDLISIKSTTNESLLRHLFEEDLGLAVDFCMCNPPFYSSLEELYESRSTTRPPPKNAFTGSPQELITEGGEITFVKRIIDESKLLKERVRIYTTMLGHKYSLNVLENELKDANIQTFIHTEFCQGRTMRWGLAWTFAKDFSFSTSDSSTKDKSKKKNNHVMSFVVPKIANKEYNVDAVSKMLQNLIRNINITFKVLNEKASNICIEIEAHENTWSNQRRKRRLMQRLKNDTNECTSDASTNKVHCNNLKCDSLCEENHKNTALEMSQPIEYEQNIENEHDSKKLKLNGNHDCPVLEENSIQTTEELSEMESINITKSVNFKSSLTTLSGCFEEVATSCGKSYHSNIDSTNASSVLHSLVTVRKNHDNILMDFEFLSGSSGKDGLHQIIQYLKNNWK